MLQTVEAIVDPTGKVRLLEALHLDQPCRAVVTLLESPSRPESAVCQASADGVWRYLEQTRLAPVSDSAQRR